MKMKNYILYTNEDDKYYVVVNKLTKNELKISKAVNTLDKIISKFGNEIEDVRLNRVEA